MPLASVVRPRRAPWLAALTLIAGAAAAQTAAPPAEPDPAGPAAAGTPASDAQAVPAKPGQQRPAPPAAKPPQRVEITGNTDANAERRRSTAAKAIYGRDELDRMGDSTLGEVLKRLPGVTIGGPPGRGGAPQMRGLGGGSPAILIDGQRMPFGFSLDSIAPEQIERIEVMRAPVAEHGARAIAGIINVVMREDFKRKANELRLGGGFEDGSRPQFGANWNLSGQHEALGYSLSVAAYQREFGDESQTHELGIDALGQTTREQFSHNAAQSRARGLHLNGRLQFKLGVGQTLDLQPMANFSRNRNHGTVLREQTSGADPAPYARADYGTESDNTMARLNGTWIRTLDGGGRLQLRFGSMLAQSHNLTRRHELDSGGFLVRDKIDDGAVRDLSLDVNGKYSQLIAERHSLSAGWEVQGGQRNDRKTTTENGLPTLTEFGDTLQARTLRLAAWAQDEWEWSKTFSFYAGLRWEGIQTRSDSPLAASDPQPGQVVAGGGVSNRSSVLTPLGHMVWKLPDAPRDQVRLSLTRSYRSPTTAQLIARPTISNFYPDLSKPNQPTSPDRAGNPDLKPELAWGLDLAFEHYLDAGGIVSANVFGRKIDNLIRAVRTQESVSWSPVPRWVSRPQNIGGAVGAGIELEAKFRASDLWATDSALSLRSNGSLLWSRVDGVSGPNNRLDQQPRYFANIGFDWPIKGSSLTIGSNLNFTPSFAVQQIDSQVYRQGVKRVIDGYALWRFGTAASARLSVANAAARDYETGNTTMLADGSEQSQDTVARSYTTVTLRLELRF